MQATLEISPFIKQSTTPYASSQTSPASHRTFTYASPFVRLPPPWFAHGLFFLTIYLHLSSQ
jgi:hypothetical protein